MDQLIDITLRSDLELAQAAQSGNLAALDELFKRYQDSLKQMYVQRTGGNIPDSNDLLQDTFIKVYLNIERFNPQYTFSQWIFTIARNTFIDYTRKRKDAVVSVEVPDRRGIPIQALANAPTPEENMILMQHNTELNSVLERMPPRYCEIIRLRFFFDYSYDEIAEKLDIPIGTVKTLIHRARELLLSQISAKDGRVL